MPNPALATTLSRSKFSGTVTLFTVDGICSLGDDTSPVPALLEAVFDVSALVLSAAAVVSAKTEAVTFLLIVVSANALVASDEDIISTDANASEILFKCIFPPKKEQISKNHYECEL